MDAYNKMSFQRKSKLSKANFIHVRALLWCLPLTSEGMTYKELIMVKLRKRPEAKLPKEVQIKEEEFWDE